MTTLQEHSSPALVEVSADQTLPHLLDARVARDPQGVIVERKTTVGGWQKVRASEYQRQARALAKGLLAAGAGPGERVAIMAHTSYDWTLIDVACWYAGLVVVPIYETSSAEQVEWILFNAQVRYLGLVAPGDLGLVVLGEPGGRRRVGQQEHARLRQQAGDEGGDGQAPGTPGAPGSRGLSGAVAHQHASFLSCGG